MKRMLVCFFIGLFILSGCQLVAGTNQKGSIETKKAISPDNSELLKTATLPGVLPSIIDPPTHTQNPAITDETTNENNQTPGVQANDQALTSSAYLLSTNNSITPTRMDTIIPLTSTPTGNYIEFINVSDRRIGKATVFWRMHGDTVNSFRVVYSETNPNPTYPNDKYEYGQNTGSPYAETAFIYGTPGHTYYVRVCEYTDIELDGCINYTNTFVFTFQAAPPTPTATEHDKIWITSIDYVSNGVAIINWQTTVNYPGGFEVVWNNSLPPTYVNEDAIYVSASERSAILMGTPGTSNYYSVCGYTNNICGDYARSISYYHQINPEPTEKISTPVPPLATIVVPTDTPSATVVIPSDTPVSTLTYTDIPIIEETTEIPLQTSEE